MSPSTVTRLQRGESSYVTKPRRLAKAATAARKKAGDYARAHKAQPVTGVPVVPKAARLKRKDFGKLGRPVPGKPGRKYTKKNLPTIDAGTVAHDVRRFSLDDTWEVLKALRDRGSKFRLVFQTPKGDKRYPSRRGSTPPLDPEDMTDADLWDWMNNDALKGAGYKPLFIMEME